MSTDITDAGMWAAATASHPDAHRAAARRPDTSWALLGNPHLDQQWWWQLAASKDLTGDQAARLYSAPLDAAQLQYALTDPRDHVIEAVLCTQAFDSQTLTWVAGRIEGTPRLIAAAAAARLRRGGGAEREGADRMVEGLLERTHVRYLPWVLSRTAGQLPEHLTVEHVTRPGIPASRLAGPVLDAIADSSRTLTAGLLAALTKDTRRPRAERAALAACIAQSRHAPSGSWQHAETLLGPDTQSHAGALLVAAVLGNPNTSTDGVAWAKGALCRRRSVIRRMPHVTRGRIDALEQTRSAPLTPVTGAWDDVRADQEGTLSALAVAGLIGVADPGAHPRVAAWLVARRGARRPADIGELPARRPGVGSPQARADWDMAMATEAGPRLDQVLDGAGVCAWTTLMALAGEWEGTCSDLTAAARNL
jgi:hypothetical protein